MRAISFISISALLATLAISPVYAQKSKSVSRFLKEQAGNPAFTQALQHAQAVANARTAALASAIEAASARAKVSTPSQLSHPVITASKRPPVLSTPQQRLKDLEEFVQTYQRFPKQSFGESALESSLRQWLDRYVRTQNHSDPIVARILQLRHEYPTAPSKKNGKSPQQWLDELEAFIQENGHYPLSDGTNRLYYGVANALSRLSANDPIAVRIRQLRKEYPPELVIKRGKSPQQWMEELEAFIQQNGRYPTKAPQEQALYSGALRALHFLEVDDPIAVRIRQLREQCGIHHHPHIF